MAQMTFMEGEDRSPARPRGTACVLSATVAGAAVGVPLLGMMGFAFTASLLLLLVAFPFLVVFSPLLLPAALVIAASVAGFGAAAAEAVAGVAALACAARTVGNRVHGPVGRFLETLTESGQRAKQQWVDTGDYLQRKLLVQPPESMEREVVRSAGRPSRGTAILLATVAGGAVGITLLGMMAFAFTASLVLLLVASPFLVVCSPLLLPAALVLAVSVAGFAAAAAMAVAGVAALAYAARTVGMRVQGPVGRFLETLT